MTTEVEFYNGAIERLQERLQKINIRVDELERLQEEHDALLNAIDTLTKLRDRAGGE